MKKIYTKNRVIISHIPHRDSVKLLKELACIEPKSMSHFSPVIWHKAEGINVWDGYGNKFLDFTSAAMVANAGHANWRIGGAIKAQIWKQLDYNYCNPSLIRLEYLKRLRAILPDYLDKVFLLTTGSEAVECAVRVVREWGQKKNMDKTDIISHTNSFHGGTMASKFLAGNNYPRQNLLGFYHIPFPNCNICPHYNQSLWNYDNCGEDCFNWSISDPNINEELIAGVIVETFRGPSATFMPKDYIKALREWTLAHDALLVFDEIQAGFGRTGKWFGFEHYNVEPDLIIVGKGMTSSLPMSAVIGKSSILDSVEGMTSTHTGNPLCLAAGIANIDVIEKEGLVENARRLGEVCREALEKLKEKYLSYIGAINGKGLAMAFYLLNPETGRIDTGLAGKVIDTCMRLGLLLLPTESAGTIKVAPPLCIDREALLEGIGVIDEAIGLCLKKGK